jgi:hypothetical protein
MRFKRGSTSYGVLVLVFFVIAIVFFLPFFFKPPVDCYLTDGKGLYLLSTIL